MQAKKDHVSSVITTCTVNERKTNLDPGLKTLPDLSWRSTSTFPCSHLEAAPDLAVSRPDRDSGPSFRAVGGGDENLATTRERKKQ